MNNTYIAIENAFKMLGQPIDEVRDNITQGNYKLSHFLPKKDDHGLFFLIKDFDENVGYREFITSNKSIYTLKTNFYCGFALVDMFSTLKFMFLKDCFKKHHNIEMRIKTVNSKNEESKKEVEAFIFTEQREGEFEEFKKFLSALDVRFDKLQKLFQDWCNELSGVDESIITSRFFTFSTAYFGEAATNPKQAGRTLMHWYYNIAHAQAYTDLLIIFDGYYLNMESFLAAASNLISCANYGEGNTDKINVSQLERKVVI